MRYRVWCTWTAYQTYNPAMKETISHQYRGVRMALARVHSVSAQARLIIARSTLLASLLFVVAVLVSPSGSSPMLSGLWRWKTMFSGTTTIRIMSANAQQLARQPSALMECCIQGKIVTDPMPTPAKAKPKARPRRLLNQFGKNRVWPI